MTKRRLLRVAVMRTSLAMTVLPRPILPETLMRSPRRYERASLSRPAHELKSTLYVRPLSACSTSVFARRSTETIVPLNRLLVLLLRP